MAVYVLTVLPYAEHLCWHKQHCPTHAAIKEAADHARTEWEPFDPVGHFLDQVAEMCTIKAAEGWVRQGRAGRQGRHHPLTCAAVVMSPPTPRYRVSSR